mgnify:CR=1 FL=1
MPFPVLVAADFAEHPRIGVELGARHLLVFFRDGAGAAAIEEALAAAGVTLMGADAGLGFAFVRLPEGSGWERLDAARTALAGHAAVEVVTYDMPLEGAVIPPPRDGQVGHPSANWLADGGFNWHLKAIDAPHAWNTLPFLQALERGRPRRVGVGVVDANFSVHPDLVGAFTAHRRLIRDGVREWAAERVVIADDTHEFAHGTFVAGLIGAVWNGSHADGVVPSPLVQIHGAVERASGSDASALPESFGQGLAYAANLLLTTDTSIRVVNVSMGYNWYDRPLTRGRCDPQPASSPQSNCEDVDVRVAIRDAGRAFAVFSHRVNRNRPVLFVAAAGNDSGPGPGGLGAFPAELASPMTNAALEQHAADIIVVGSHEVVASTRGAVTESSFSNKGAHVMAPGRNVGSLTGANGAWVVGPSSGTSFAAPLVAGAAAYLHLLDPRLDNAGLIRLLTLNEQTVTDPRTGSTRRMPVLDLGGAVAAMEVLLPGGGTVNGGTLMADLDDGSEDGFERRPGFTPSVRDYREVRVDIRDMRAFRDAWWLTHPDPAAPIVCPLNVAACDLNRDGMARLTPPQEPYARAALVGRDIDEAALARLAERWTGGFGPQAFSAADLPALLRSADLHVEAAAFLARARIEGVAGATMTLTGTGGQPTAIDTLRDLTLPEAPTMFTTPLIGEAGIVVSAGGRTFSGRIGDLRIAEDRDISLNPCVWDDPNAALLTPSPGGCDDDDGQADDSPFRPGGGGLDGGLDGGASWPRRPRGGSDAGSVGDPHLRTWDGLLYDFQGAGEFVLVRDEAREIQARQVPLAGGRGLAVNAAVAFKVGDDRVMIRRGERDKIWLNGQVKELAGALALADADLTPGPGTMLIQWKDGDQLGVVIHDDALDLYPVFAAHPGRARAGLLGPAPNGDPNDDLVGRDGTVFREPSARALHREYGESWRVAADASLFAYAAGESAATFADREFPRALGTVADLSPTAYAAAHERCTRAGVRQAGLLEACILDVAAMDRPSAAWSFRGISDPKATWSPATFRSDFEAGVPEGWIYAGDPASILAPPRGTGPSGRFYGPFPVATLPEQAPMLTLRDLGEHEALAIAFDVVVLGEWRGNAADAAIVEVRELQRPIVYTNYATGTGRQAFPASAHAGDFAAGTGALARTERGTTYRHRVVVPHTLDLTVLTFFVHGGAGERWGLDNVEVTTLHDPGLRVEPIAVGDEIFRVVHAAAAEPRLAGCADGTREAFHDAAREPGIAGCLAAWSDAKSLAEPGTGAACGDGAGACAVPADACAAGWHVCHADDLRAIEPLRCLGAGVGQFVAAASVCAADGACGAAGACQAEGSCAPAICCGTFCARPDACDDGVWLDLTFRVADACAAAPANPTRGVLCCRDAGE